MPPPSGWTVIWCDELAFKAASQAKRDELEQMGIRVKAHKTAERCIRSLDKRAKKINPAPGEPGPSAESPKTLALVTEENHELVPYLVERPVLVRNIIFLASSGGEAVWSARYEQSKPILHSVVGTWEDAVEVVRQFLLAEPPDFNGEPAQPLTDEEDDEK
jgi:hypothetical protein